MKQINKLLSNKSFAVVLYAAAAAGIVCMLIPGWNGNDSSPPTEEEYTAEVWNNSGEEVERRLEQLLSMAEGAGRVKVMITYKNNGSAVIAENKDMEESYDESSRQTSSRSEVTFNNENKPVVISQAAPEIEGVVIVAEGGGDIETKNSLIRAAQALLGAEPHKIEVLKMKTEG